MNDTISIQADHVAKSFRLYSDKGIYLKEKILFKNRRRYEERDVLKDISFQVRRGEAVGLVGENGCGKSTLLKMLSRIMYPDQGSVTMRGRVSALIELGAGFHPDLSGRENIYTNAAIFGLGRKEIDRRLQTIIDFSELGAYIDNPVRTYSSGMYMRLAFSVAINVDADILLVDEILAVGDAAFQQKCFDKLKEIKKQGTTIVIVSHALNQIEEICDRSFWISGGYIQAQGFPADVHREYLRYLAERSGTLHQQERSGDPETNGKRWGNKDVVFDRVTLENEQGEETLTLDSGRPFRIVMRYRTEKTMEDVVFGMGIFRKDGVHCYGTNTYIDHLPIRLSPGRGTTVCEVNPNGLLEGEYLLDVSVHRPDGLPYDFYRECQAFTVKSALKDIGTVRLEHSWRLTGESVTGEMATGGAEA